MEDFLAYLVLSAVFGAFVASVFDHEDFLARRRDVCIQWQFILALVTN